MLKDVVRHHAEKIAEEANQCCKRNDGYEEHMAAVAESHIWDTLKAVRIDSGVTPDSVSGVVGYPPDSDNP